MKRLCLLCCYLATLVMFWFAILCDPAYESDDTTLLLYIAAITGGLFINATIPLFYELAVEAVFPVAEGVTGERVVSDPI